MPHALYADAFTITPPADLLQSHPELTAIATTLSEKYAAQKAVTEDELRQLGSLLWQHLDIDTAFQATRQRAGQQILRLVIESSDPKLLALPWEMLYHPEEGFLGKSRYYTLSRTIPNPAEPLPLQNGPLRVLLFSASPEGQNALQVEDEQAQVIEALLTWIGKGRVVFECPEDGRFESLRESLDRFQPQLVFLSGHGKFYPALPHSGEEPYGVFLFETETSQEDPVKDHQLAELFRGTQVQCLVLTACESAKTTSAALNHGLTRRLNHLGMGHVIGMRESILDIAGILFSRAFCDAIAQENPSDFALQRGREAISHLTPGSVARRDAAASGEAEQGQVQWCLPLQLSQQVGRPLIEWQFEPVKPQQSNRKLQLNGISLPELFIGRRTELRRWRQPLLEGRLEQLLICGPGGQGKTALAGKLTKLLRDQDYLLLAYSAREGSKRDNFILRCELQLKGSYIELYERAKQAFDEPLEQNRYLLDYLLQQQKGKVALFLDNLESVQDPDSLALNDSWVQSWIELAQEFSDQGLKLILTSRWQLPDWPQQTLCNLGHLSYNDFLKIALQLVKQQRLSAAFVANRDRLPQVYKALNGNPRALEFFAAAIESINDPGQEEAFLAALSEASEKAQLDMALAQIVAHLSESETELLIRTPAYLTPVPIEGLKRLALVEPKVASGDELEQAIRRLVAVSLLEKGYDEELERECYLCTPLVSEWLLKSGYPPPTRPQLQRAAHYQQKLFDDLQGDAVVARAVVVYQALQRAEELESSYRFALDRIVGPLNNAGRYQTLLDEWLPSLCQSSEPKTQARALNQTGKQHLHLSNYETALQYLKQSLDIQQQIGDKSGEGTTLNNMATTAHARGDYDTALQYLKQSLDIQQQIGDKSGEGTTLNNMATTAHARGDYDTALQYLKQSLDIQQQIGDKSGEGTTLNNISQIYDARGDYDTALQYLNLSLAIRQEIGDTAGLCATLFNMGHIHMQNEEIQQAVGAWVTVYKIASKINLAQVLEALENLAPQLGLPEGLEGGAMLAERMPADPDE